MTTMPKTTDFACPTCGAEVGKSCVTLYSPQYKYAAKAHQPRIRLMLAALERVIGATPSQSEFTDAERIAEKLTADDLPMSSCDCLECRIRVVMAVLRVVASGEASS